ncbi:MAG: alpha/beta hydrolase [Nevskia sp.]|nr:alpha/beta hydrolase [Nevskia sp.]
MRRIFLGVAGWLALAWLAACSGQQVLNAVTPDSGYALASNVAFGGNGLKLDVYAPEGASGAPVVVFFFGGRWQEGRKEDYKFVGQALAARGMVVVIPGQRLYPQVRYPDFLYDAADAVAWAHANIAGYGGSADKIVVMGHSSGAYNAAMLALDPEFMKRAGGDRAWLRGMIGLAGPYDFLPLTDPDLRDLFGPPEDYEKTQPVQHVDGRNPPLLLMHGQKDETVAVSNTNNLFERVRRAGGTVDKVLYPKLDHRWLIADVATRFQGNADVVNHIEMFAKQVTSGNAQEPASSIQTSAPDQ